MYGFVFTVGQTVDRGDPLDQRESHWYRTFVGILRLMRPSKGIEAVSRAPQLPKNPLETRMIPAFPSILIMGCVSKQPLPTILFGSPHSLALFNHLEPLVKYRQWISRTVALASAAPAPPARLINNI